MITIRVIDQDGNESSVTCEPGITPARIAQSMDLPYEILSCRINNVNSRLDTEIGMDCRLELLDLRDNYANMSYQASLSFLFIKAVHDVLGDDAHIKISNSLSKGLFMNVKHCNSEEQCEEIQKRMQELVEEDHPFYETHVSRKKILEYLKSVNSKRRIRLFESSESIDEAKLCRFMDKEDIFYLHLLPSSSFLTKFEVRKYKKGVLLRFPHPTNPDVIPPFEEQKLLYDAFREETQWEHLMNIDYAPDLNESMRDNYKEIIMISEALHEKKIAELAGMIKDEKKRIILIAGPSSSGKTSFAKRLCTQLRVVGLKPLYLGTDDYFVDRKDMEPGPDGKLDFECLEAVDVDLFSKQMNALLAGEEVDLPTFDFIEGVKKYGDRITSIDSTQPIVIEGIHGLNPAMSLGIPDDSKFRIYISPLTSLNIDEHHRVPTTDARMLRRMVRDYRTRGKTAEQTILDWTSVRRGEDKWIFPFSDTANVFFNSSCIYELSVLKKYADPLLEEIGCDSPAYPEARRMIDFLKFFADVPDDSCIANNSILREFIGGSILVN